MFSQISLKVKLLISFLIISCFVLLVAGVAYFSFNRAIKEYSHVVDVNFENQIAMADMRDSLRVIQSEMSNIILHGKSSKPAAQESFDIIKKEINIYLEKDKRYQVIPFVEGEAELYNKVSESSKKYLNKVNDFLILYEQTGVDEKLEVNFNSGLHEANDEAIDQLTNLMKFQTTEAYKWTKNSREDSSQSKKLIFIIGITCIVLSIAIAVILSSTISKELTRVILELNNSTPTLTTSATTLNKLSSDMSSSATEQAAAVQETASSLEEISAMIKRNSDNSNSAKTYTEDCLKYVKDGQSAVENMKSAINEINQNNENFNSFIEKNNAELNEMVRVITNISDKTKVINDIVFQTKLLSFNASVEAARAGDQGKGFAVVAEEVGNLAVMSGTAANEISSLLEESIKKVNSIVSNTKSQVDKLAEEGKLKIQNGIVRAEECNIKLNEINQSVINVNAMVSEVADASTEQSKGIEEVAKAMGQIDEVTTQNTMSSQQISNNANETLNQSNKISTIAQDLQKLLRGNSDSKLKPDAGEVKNTTKNIKIEKPITLKEQVASIKIEPSKENRKEEVKELKPVQKIEKIEKKVSPPLSKITINEKKPATIVIDALPSRDDSRFEEV